MYKGWNMNVSKKKNIIYYSHFLILSTASSVLSWLLKAVRRK